MKCFNFLLFYNAFDLNNQKILCLSSIYQFDKKLGFWTTLKNTLFCKRGPALLWWGAGLLIRDQLPVDLARSITFSLVHSCIFASVITKWGEMLSEPLSLFYGPVSLKFSYNHRACVSMSARAAWHPRNFKNVHWHPQNLRLPACSFL